MRNGKMKTLHGLYKTLGRDLFLELAKNYSDHVHDTIDATLDEMECRWFDAAHTITEADKMVEDYNRGRLLGYDVGVTVTAAPAMKMEVMS
ncbi:MAG: hypothetical protein J6128_02515 [Clostridia bacterium]|nr:hypothetical protein [Clostridia bacterium]